MLLEKRDTNYLYIVCSFEKNSFSIIPVWASNCTSHIPYEKKLSENTCPCYLENGESDLLCPHCAGFGIVKTESDSIDDYIFEAANVKDFITKTLTKGFNF